MRRSDGTAMRAVGLGAVLLVFAAGVTGCSQDERGKGDAPVGARIESPRDAWQNIDGFPNVVAFCIGENGVYTNSREADPVDVVVDDPNCDEGGVLFEG